MIDIVLKQFVPIVIALVVVILIYTFIKKFLIHFSILEPDRKGIFALEIVALALIFVAFVFGELIHIFHDIYNLIQKETEIIENLKESSARIIGLTFSDVLLILLSLAGSLAIYAAFVNLLGLNGREAVRPPRKSWWLDIWDRLKKAASA